MKIAQGLLLRKQLEKKVAQLEPLRMSDPRMFEVKTTRVNVNDNLDEVAFNVPRITLADMTSEYDKYASALRKLDAALQQANWQYDLPSFNDTDNPYKMKPGSAAGFQTKPVANAPTGDTVAPTA